MLVITRRIGEGLAIFPDSSLDSTMTVRELFQRGPIDIRVLDAMGNQVRIGIDAPMAVRILRDELVP